MSTRVLFSTNLGGFGEQFAEEFRRAMWRRGHHPAGPVREASDDTALSLARIVLRGVPPAFKQAFDDVSQSRSLEEWELAYEGLLYLVMAVASDFPDHREALGGVRAWCPLCGLGATSNYSRPGFSLPEGLERHLRGFGNTYRCDVIRALDITSEDLKHSMAGALHDEQDPSSAPIRSVSQRMAEEILYQRGARQSPVLVDTGLPPRQVRGPKEIAWAERRLKEMGFSRSGRHSNVVCWVKTHPSDPSVTIYADVRRKGHTVFRVYQGRQPLRPGVEPLLCGHAILQDRFTQGLWARIAPDIDDVLARFREYQALEEALLRQG